MKSAVSLAMSICLVSSAPTVPAQDRIVPTSGPIARAITREAVRLAAVQQVGKPPDSDWARLRRLAPGTEMTVTVRGSQAGKRYVVSVRDAALTVLNVTDPSLPDPATRALLNIAANHPEYFAGAQSGGAFLVDKSVRLASDSVFVADQKVADLGHLIEIIPVTNIVEITARRRHGSGWGAVGGAVGISLLTWALEANASPSYGLFFTSLFGAPVAGAVAGYYGFGRPIEEVIYRAP